MAGRPSRDAVPIGRVLKAHGVRGEMAVQAYGETLESIRDGERLWLGDRAAVMEGLRPGKGRGWILKLAEISDRDAAAEARGRELFVPRARLAELDDDEYYGHDLIGLRVETEAHEKLGELVEILDHGIHDVYRVVDGTTERLLPAVREVIRSIDLEAGLITVHLLDQD